MVGVSTSWKLTPAETPKQADSAFEILPPKQLLTPRRMDLAVKWRYFRHLSGGSDPEAEGVYCWHIIERVGSRMKNGLPTDAWKVTISDYIRAAQALHSSMQSNGYDSRQPIPLDMNGELFGGAHRVACALALNLPFVSVLRMNKQVWAPPWNEAWFEDHGMSQKELKRLRDDWELMRW